ncbi:MAG: gliding motility-associated C-terminal domain-containing protein [Bacteroidales bacterium]|nr:gliding motility-associated C-terminal domain-containing protein [Bacteroidales bacterium]
MKKLIFCILLCLIYIAVFATHERAAEITYRHISGLTFEVTIITYTYSPSLADRPELEIKWGDETSSILLRIEMIDYPNDIRRNVYVGTHTYPGPATFIISMEDPNRNHGVINIPNSVNIPIYVETELVIHPFLGENSSPVLLNPPIDYGCVNRKYIHNPGAYDIDGDSLSYRFVDCKGAGGLPIPGYTLPMTSNIFTLNSKTGDLYWDSPVLQGEYNVAFLIEEWRKGQRIGFVTRDMQILINACDNYPPEIHSISDTCIEAGSLLTFDVIALDPDLDLITLTATGGPLVLNHDSAYIIPDPAFGIGADTTTFFWQTLCTHVQKYPYQAYFKAVDNSIPISLIDYKTVNITIIGPAPENLTTTPLGNTIEVSWDKTICNNASGYKIYRNNSYYGFFPGYCETGVPSYTGYTLIKEIPDINITSFIDNNNGNGLIHGIDYCYMIIAYFPDGAESYASLEICTTLKKDIPIITNVSINSTDENTGSSYIAWSKPTELDTIQTPGPFKYLLYRSEGLGSTDFELIKTYTELNDTTYTDTLLNTEKFSYNYRIDLYNDEPGNYFLIGSTQVASSMFISIYETDRELQLSWNTNVPWINEQYIIYRQNPETLLFDSIGLSLIPAFNDTGLVNGNEYCYKIKSIGKYSAPGLIDPIINFSQIKCAVPIDNVPPCSPVLTVSTNCEMLNNELSWIYPDTCKIEDLEYNVYYSIGTDEDFIRIASTNQTFYIHESVPPRIVGCYAISAVDSIGNESQYSNIVCINNDVCLIYKLPNIFTPNNDGKNDVFKAFPESIGSVEQIKLSLFNRWGVIVYETTDPYFNWDGKDKSNNNDCNEGVYYFVCEVNEITLKGLVKRTIKGSVTLLK